MKIAIDRRIKIILIQWLKQGYIETLDLPEAYKDSTFFEQLLKQPVEGEDLTERINALHDDWDNDN